MTIKAALAMGADALNQANIESSCLDASILLAHSLKIKRTHMLINNDKTISNGELSSFNALIKRRCQHEPVAYIIGEKEFWSLDFYVTRDTLIPRPDSETLIEAALKRVRNRTDKREQAQGQAKPIKILDIGTGTGCLIIALLKELPQAIGIGVDKCERALQVAQKNAERHCVDSRVAFVQSHWCDALEGTFDLIISNPPYIAESNSAELMPDVRCFEPHTALFAGIDGLNAYRELAPSLNWLSPTGHIIFELGDTQAESVSHLFEQHGLLVEALENDLSGKTRCIVARYMH